MLRAAEAGAVAGAFALLGDRPERATALDRDFLDFATRFNRGRRPMGRSSIATSYLRIIARPRGRHLRPGPSGRPAGRVQKSAPAAWDPARIRISGATDAVSAVLDDDGDVSTGPRQGGQMTSPPAPEPAVGRRRAHRSEDEVERAVDRAAAIAAACARPGGAAA